MSEFDEIARLFRPLTLGAPEALDLRDDAAVIASRPGSDLVVTKDAIVGGVHFLADDPWDLVARKLLRVNLSDLAAKAAEPFGCFLAVAWPAGCDVGRREAFARGLHQDQLAFGVALLGGDTVSTPGPLTASLTLLGWVPTGRMVKRSTARSRDLILVSGVIGDGGLGLRSAQGELTTAGGDDATYLADRYRLPEPRLALQAPLRAYASAAADVSDGLLADVGHIAEASGLGARIMLDRTPLSGAAAAWLAVQPQEVEGRLELAAMGDDYEIVCTVAPADVDGFIAAARNLGVPTTVIGEMVQEAGLQVFYKGVPTPVSRKGWTHL